MYSIGEYARIAQVSKRLLRYYDEIGLFQPVKIDRESGHRYYSATQLPELNRILALKDLGISLNQIQRFVRDEISATEIQGMLSLRKAELEQQVLEELQRIRTIESRLKQIQERDSLVKDVIVKQVPEQRFVSARKVLSQVESPDDFFWAVLNVLTQGDRGSKGKMTIIFHEDGIESDYIDMEFGKSLDRSSRLTLANHNGITLTDKSLSSATMATFVPQTKDCSKLLGYNAIADWVEANHYDLAGAVRLVFLELPKQPGDDDYVMEIQFPVRKREVELNLQSLN